MDKKLLIDAQLPHLMCEIFNSKGVDAIHVDDLPSGDESTDGEIITFADQNGYMVVSKDTDFYHSHMLHQRPARLLLIQTGNIKNRELFDLIRRNEEIIKRYIKECSFVELYHEGVFGR